ncbi:MAG: hypothetical protein NVS3B20_03800 [Polyangiales bacterium]
MSATFVLRILERIHGHLGWLAVAALLHPAILLRNPKRRAHLSVLFATVTAMVAGTLGASIYPAYRAHLKRQIFTDAPSIGWLFERKEHLAVGALGFALVGGIAYFASRSMGKHLSRMMMARLAHRAFIVAAVLSLAVAMIGVIVASFRSF